MAEDLGRGRDHSAHVTTIRARNITSSRCSPIRPAGFTWGMCAIMRWAMSSPASCARAGYNVLHPMGWDAFGMPAENAADAEQDASGDMDLRQYRHHAGAAQIHGPVARLVARDRDLRSQPITNISRSCFSIFSRAGLVDRKKSKVNWDPVDHTVLANEQVIDGRGWRSGALVEQRELTQWFFKISDFADDLLAALDDLPRWPEKVRLMQKNWIGKSEGLQLRFALEPLVERRCPRDRSLYDAARYALRREIYRARARSSVGAPIAKDDPALAAFIAECQHLGTSEAAIETAEKRGYDTGLRARHPFDADWLLPVYVANFVLMDYGTGAIFGCPAHDQRDLDFANAYGLGNTPVVCPPDVDPAQFTITDTAYDGDGRLDQFALSRRPDDARNAKEEVAAGSKQVTLGNRPQAQAAGQLSPARLGHFAPALLGLPDPDHPLREMRRGAGAGRRSAGRTAARCHLRRAGQSARPPSDLETCHLPAMRRPGPARDGHDGHVRRFVLVFSALHRSVEHQRADDGRRGRAMAAGRSIYRRHRTRDPAPALFALLHPRDAARPATPTI